MGSRAGKSRLYRQNAEAYEENRNKWSQAVGLLIVVHGSNFMAEAMQFLPHGDSVANAYAYENCADAPIQLQERLQLQRQE
jgi:hypothetical protein